MSKSVNNSQIQPDNNLSFQLYSNAFFVCEKVENKTVDVTESKSVLGFGIMSNCDFYCGSLNNHKPEGLGIWILNNGGFIYGNFKDGKANGNCILKYPNSDFSYATFVNGYYEGICLKYNKKLDKTRACCYRQGAQKISYQIFDGKPNEQHLIEYELDAKLNLKDLEKLFSNSKNLLCTISEKNVFFGSCKESIENILVKHGVCYNMETSTGLLEYGVFVEDQLDCFGRRATRNYDSWTGNFIKQKGILHSYKSGEWSFGIFTQSLKIAKKYSTAKSLIPPIYTDLDKFVKQFDAFECEDLTYIEMDLDVVSFRKRYTEKLTKDFSCMTFALPGVDSDLYIERLIIESQKYEQKLSMLDQDSIEKNIVFINMSVHSNSRKSSVNKSKGSINKSGRNLKNFTEENVTNQTNITQNNPVQGYNLFRKGKNTKEKCDLQSSNENCNNKPSDTSEIFANKQVDIENLSTENKIRGSVKTNEKSKDLNYSEIPRDSFANNSEIPRDSFANKEVEIENLSTENKKKSSVRTNEKNSVKTNTKNSVITNTKSSVKTNEKNKKLDDSEIPRDSFAYKEVDIENLSTENKKRGSVITNGKSSELNDFEIPRDSFVKVDNLNSEKNSTNIVSSLKAIKKNLAENEKNMDKFNTADQLNVYNKKKRPGAQSSSRSIKSRERSMKSIKSRDKSTKSKEKSDQNISTKNKADNQLQEINLELNQNDQTKAHSNSELSKLNKNVPSLPIVKTKDSIYELNNTNDEEIYIEDQSPTEINQVKVSENLKKSKAKNNKISKGKKTKSGSKNKSSTEEEPKSSGKNIEIPSKNDSDPSKGILKTKLGSKNKSSTEEEPKSSGKKIEIPSKNDSDFKNSILQQKSGSKNRIRGSFEEELDLPIEIENKTEKEFNVVENEKTDLRRKSSKKLIQDQRYSNPTTDRERNIEFTDEYKYSEEKTVSKNEENMINYLTEKNTDRKHDKDTNNYLSPRIFVTSTSNNTNQNTPGKHSRAISHARTNLTNRECNDVYEEMFRRINDLNQRLDKYGIKADENEVIKRSEMILSVVGEKSQFNLGDTSEFGLSPSQSLRGKRTKSKFDNYQDSPLLTRTNPRQNKSTENDDLLEEASIVNSHDIKDSPPPNQQNLIANKEKLPNPSKPNSFVTKNTLEIKKSPKRVPIKTEQPKRVQSQKSLKGVTKRYNEIIIEEKDFSDNSNKEYRENTPEIVRKVQDNKNGKPTLKNSKDSYSGKKPGKHQNSMVGKSNETYGRNKTSIDSLNSNSRGKSIEFMVYHNLTELEYSVSEKSE